MVSAHASVVAFVHVHDGIECYHVVLHICKMSGCHYDIEDGQGKICRVLAMMS